MKASKNLIGGADTSSRPTRPGGFGRRLPEQSPISHHPVPVHMVEVINKVKSVTRRVGGQAGT
jgi:hypothetical protein